MDKKIVSVIVPIYNVERYLERCLNSLINQTYSNLEIILVDDGSTDSCPVICDAYEKEDNRIKVIHKKNGGLSDARNVGIDNSSGSYLLFVDSDDYIKEDAIQVLMNTAEKYSADIVEGAAISVTKTGEKYNFASPNILENHIYTGIDYAINRINNHCFYAAVWLKLYNRSYINNIDLRFVKGRLHEDEIWNPQAIINAKKIVYINYPFYYYDITREGSIMNKISKRNVQCTFDNCYELEKFYKSIDLNKSEKKVLFSYIAKQYMMVSFKCIQDLKWYKENIDKNFVLRNAKKLTIFLVALLYCTNINLFMKLLKKRSKESI